MSHNLGKYSLIAMATLTSGALIISSTMGNALEMNPSQPVNSSQFNNILLIYLLNLKLFGENQL